RRPAAASARGGVGGGRRSGYWSRSCTPGVRFPDQNGWVRAEGRAGRSGGRAVSAGAALLARQLRDGGHDVVGDEPAPGAATAAVTVGIDRAAKAHDGAP